MQIPTEAAEALRVLLVLAAKAPGTSAQDMQVALNLVSLVNDAEAKARAIQKPQIVSDEKAA